MKIKKVCFISLILFMCVSCNKQINTTSSITNTVNFYNDNNYSITDKDMDKENILVLIISTTCSHCREIEPLLQQVKEATFSFLTFVTVFTYQTSIYSLPKNYNDSVAFYYSQGSDYVDPYFLPDLLYTYSDFPTPTALYLGEERELKHILFGLNSTIDGLVSDINLLIDIDEEKAG